MSLCPVRAQRPLPMRPQAAPSVGLSDLRASVSACYAIVRLICNQGVTGSSPVGGTRKTLGFSPFPRRQLKAAVPRRGARAQIWGLAPCG